jgi:hypothetical protein
MKYPKYPILLTGHSLGAALSDLCAVDLFLNNFKNLQLFLFGSPRRLNFLNFLNFQVGNVDFMKFVHENIKKRLNVVNQRDIVTGLPLRIMGFTHIPQEIWFPHNHTFFKVCDCCKIDPSCSHSNRFRTSIENHLVYLGHDRRHSKKFNCP